MQRGLGKDSARRVGVKNWTILKVRMRIVKEDLPAA